MTFEGSPKQEQMETMAPDSFPGKMGNTTTTHPPLSIDLAATAQRFADCCYDAALRMPSAEAMARLEKAGIVQRIPTGGWVETPRLRQLGY